jgi:hypothetical protein
MRDVKIFLKRNEIIMKGWENDWFLVYWWCIVNFVLRNKKMPEQSQSFPVEPQDEFLPAPQPVAQDPEVSSLAADTASARGSRRGLVIGLLVASYILSLLLVAGGVFWWRQTEINLLQTNLDFTKNQLSTADATVVTLQADLTETEIELAKVSADLVELQKSSGSSSTSRSTLPLDSNGGSGVTSGSSSSSSATGVTFETYILSEDIDLTMPLFASQVDVTIEATECCGQLTAAQAVAELDYISSAQGFTFDQTDPLIQKIKSQVPDLSRYTIGVADSEEVLAYRVDARDKIDRVYMAITYKLLDLD